MSYQVRLTPEAEIDLSNLLGWLLAEGAGETGVRWHAGMKKAIASLADFPARCPLAPESKSEPYDVRQLLYGRKPHIYRMLFTIEGDLVAVLHIRGPRQNLAPLN